MAYMTGGFWMVLGGELMKAMDTREDEHGT